MIGLFAGALGVPVARDFYALDFPTDEVAAEVMLIAVGALVLLETVWRFRAAWTRARRRGRSGRERRRARRYSQPFFLNRV